MRVNETTVRMGLSFSRQLDRMFCWPWCRAAKIEDWLLDLGYAVLIRLSSKAMALHEMHRCRYDDVLILGGPGPIDRFSDGPGW